jgi:DNA-binding NarL/FixJ family response regulator
MSEVKKNKVIIVDDHLLFSQSLKFLIDSFDEFEVIHSFENGKEFINFIQENDAVEVDLILMDVNMPIMDGLAAMKWLKTNKSDLKAIALSVNDDEDVIIKMIKNGAKGYLLKDTSPHIFHEALNAVIDTGYFFTEMVSGILVNKIGGENNKLDFKDKEIEFIRLACTEKTYREIAVEMCLSPKTIDGYREVIFNKLKIKTRIGLVLYAIKNKIVLI